MNELQRLKLELRDERKKNKLLVEAYREVFEKLDKLESVLRGIIDG